jgi:uncharacterized delta-60 repeat protein
MLMHFFRRSTLMAAISIATTSIATTVTAHAGMAVLDPAFNGSGMVVTSLADNLHATARSVIEQPDGKLVVVGNTYEGSNDKGAAFMLLRYNTDGTLDATFNGDGMVLKPIGDKRDIAYAVVQQDDGKLVVAGGSEGGPALGSFALLRCNADGSLDSSFNGSGTVVSTLNIGNVSAFALIQQADGKLLAAGHDNANGFALVRYNRNGSLDGSFGNGLGYVITKVGSRAWGTSLLQQADGKIVIAGHSGDLHAMALPRYLPDGSLDKSFGEAGIVNTVFAGSKTLTNSVIEQADGKLVVAGTAAVDVDGKSVQGMAAARYNPDGTLDGGFGVGGKQVVIAAEPSTARSVVLQPDGKYLLAGHQHRSEGQHDIVLARLNEDGSIDTAFGINGRDVLPDSHHGNDFAGNMVSTREGSLVVVGSSATSGTSPLGDALVIRLKVE